MSEVKVSAKAIEALRTFKLPKNLGFGKLMSPVMINCDYTEGKWGDMELIPYGHIHLLPTAKVLHYGQEIFEGMKAYRSEVCPLLFRPQKNWERFNRSARRMAMPEIAEDAFINAVKIITSYSAYLIPENSGESLYLRPFMIGTEETLGIRPSEDYKFMIVASPSSSYFTNDAVSVMIERDAVRACHGGMGFAKTGGNYAGSLQTAIKVQKSGYAQTLWLDAHDRKYIEELSGMNFFAVIDGRLHTPMLTDTILDGITRNSIIHLATTKFNLEVVEERMNIETLINLIKEKRATEAFACGTAAIITPIKLLGEHEGAHYEFLQSKGDVTMKLKNSLLGIQEGRDQGPDGWVIKVALPDEKFRLND